MRTLPRKIPNPNTIIDRRRDSGWGKMLPERDFERNITEIPNAKLTPPKMHQPDPHRLFLQEGPETVSMSMFHPSKTHPLLELMAVLPSIKRKRDKMLKIPTLPRTRLYDV